VSFRRKRTNPVTFSPFSSATFPGFYLSGQVLSLYSNPTHAPTFTKAQLKKPGGTITIVYDAAAKAAVKETAMKSGTQRVMVLHLESSDQLTYSFAL
jgi:hypothetical protein